MRTKEIEDKIMGEVWDTLLGKGWLRLPCDKFVLPYQQLEPITFAEVLEHEKQLVFAICDKYCPKKKDMN